MTRKTYRKLAEQIGLLLATNGNNNSETWSLIDVFCEAMKSDNSAFDKDRFVEAIEATRAATIKRWDDRALQALTNSIVQGNG